MRKHKEVIQAWLDGKDIQYKIDINGIWKTFSDSTTINPMTYEYPEWRIKPDVHTLKIPMFSNTSNVTTYFDKEAREIVIQYEEEAL